MSTLHLLVHDMSSLSPEPDSGRKTPGEKTPLILFVCVIHNETGRDKTQF